MAGRGHKTRTAFRDDRARNRILVVAGYNVTRLTWNQLDDEPEAVGADLRVLLYQALRTNPVNSSRETEPGT
jgi:hypothetical protein